MGTINTFKYLIFNPRTPCLSMYLNHKSLICRIKIIVYMLSPCCTNKHMLIFFCLLSVHGGKGIRYTANEDTPPEKRRCQLCHVKLAEQLTAALTSV